MAVTLPDFKPKHPYIPIHTSDRGTFKRCRRRFMFTSPIQMHLQPKVSYFGIVWPLWFGSLIHKALQEYYDPVLRRDPVEVFQTEYTAARRKIRAENQDYYEDSETQELFDEHEVLGINMLIGYKEYAEAQDDFEVIAVEHDFYVPLG